METHHASSGVKAEMYWKGPRGGKLWKVVSFLQSFYSILPVIGFWANKFKRKHLMFSSETRSNFRKRKGHRKRYFIYQGISVPIPSKPTLESSQVPAPWNIPSLGSCSCRGGSRAPKQCFTSQARGVIVLARERAGGGTGWGKPAPPRPAGSRARRSPRGAPGSERASDSQRPSLGGRGYRAEAAPGAARTLRAARLSWAAGECASETRAESDSPARWGPAYLPPSAPQLPANAPNLPSSHPTTTRSEPLPLVNPSLFVGRLTDSTLRSPF